VLFLDTSALVKAYLTEQGTPTVQALFSRMEGRIAITEFVALAVLTTFGKNLRTNEIRRRAYVKAKDEFLRDYPDAFEVLEGERPVVETAFSLADTHKYVGVGAMDPRSFTTLRALRKRGISKCVTGLQRG
jgi:predicted nucleic acid-binding protein